MAKKNKKRLPQPVPAPARVKTVEDLAARPSAAKLSRRGGRETVDALVVAFVLAFLIRTFTAEAFVIPTGSMAPTLMGRHKDVFCDQCGTRFKVNSSDDATEGLARVKAEEKILDREAQELRRRIQSGLADPGKVKAYLRNRQQQLDEARERIASSVCVAGQCAQCRYITPLSEALPERMLPAGSDSVDQTANFSGDRLVVSKSAYSFSNPKRWDVAVFKYPGNSQTNYIKRITGLPGEELRIFQGDLFTRPLGSDGGFEIARKPPSQVLAMRQFVHDTDHETATLVNAGWPLAWRGDDSWNVETEASTSGSGAEVVRPTYRGEAGEDATDWLRYHHTPPTDAYWEKALEAAEPIDFAPEPQLITDFTPYNTRITFPEAKQSYETYGRLTLGGFAAGQDQRGRLGLHWVGDLMVEADLRVGSAGEVSLELVEGGVHYGVTILVDSGAATFWRRPFESDEREVLTEASTGLRASGRHAVRLANFDNRLLLWIDGSLVEADASYASDETDAVGDAQTPRTSELDPGDLAPAGVGVRGGTLTVDRLRVWRDGYYIATRNGEISGPDSIGFITDLGRSDFEDRDSQRIEQLPESPDLWYAFANRNRVDFPIEEGQLFVMGDNSGFSLDARLWAGGNGRDGGKPGGPYLERTQLVGKAVCVYWPHAWYSVPGTGRRVPAWPNFTDMRLVR